MKSFIPFLLAIFASQGIYAQFEYLSPVPGATLVTTGHNIIIREGHYVNPAFLKNDLFTIRGSKSGDHDFKMVLSTDGKTIVLTPSTPFGYSEEVTVTINKGLQTSERKTLNPYSFSFFTQREYTTEEKRRLQNARMVEWKQELEEAGFPDHPEEASDGDTRSLITGGFEITVNTAPSPGLIFFDSFNGYGDGSIYNGLHIINANGDSVYSSEGFTGVSDWDLNPNGYLAYENHELEQFELLDSNYNIVDHYTAANGYETNGHEFTKYANGHVFMLADETQIMDLTVYNPTYNSNATVIWGVVQEFDENKNLVFEWRSFDHVSVTETNQSLTNAVIDATHTNSIELDTDGNIIVSHRDLNQIVKINHSTGAFMWRLGGQLNEFTFPNDAEQFNFQHDGRLLDNGHLTLWDNGNWHSPHHSTAKEYQLDYVNHTATLVWSYTPLNPSTGNAVFFPAMGNVQRLSTGNTFINCGLDFSSSQPNLIEVTPAGQIVWELILNNDSYLICYRAHHHDWDPCAPVNPPSIKVKKITATSAKILWDDVSNAASYDVHYRKLGKLNWKLKNTTATSRKLGGLTAQTSYEFQVRANCANAFISDWSPLDTFTTAVQKVFVAEEPQQVLRMDLYPNPVNDLLTLEWNSDSDAPATISIYDVTGRLMLTSSGFNAGDEKLQLNVSSLLPGYYVAKMSFGNVKQMAPFIKQ